MGQVYIAAPLSLQEASCLLFNSNGAVSVAALPRLSSFPLSQLIYAKWDRVRSAQSNRERKEKRKRRKERKTKIYQEAREKMGSIGAVLAESSGLVVAFDTTASSGCPMVAHLLGKWRRHSRSHTYYYSLFFT